MFSVSGSSQKQLGTHRLCFDGLSTQKVLPTFREPFLYSTKKDTQEKEGRSRSVRAGGITNVVVERKSFIRTRGKKYDKACSANKKQFAAGAIGKNDDLMSEETLWPGRKKGERWGGKVIFKGKSSKEMLSVFKHTLIHSKNRGGLLLLFFWEYEVFLWSCVSLVDTGLETGLVTCGRVRVLALII